MEKTNLHYKKTLAYKDKGKIQWCYVIFIFYKGNIALAEKKFKYFLQNKNNICYSQTNIFFALFLSG